VRGPLHRRRQHERHAVDEDDDHWLARPLERVEERHLPALHLEGRRALLLADEVEVVAHDRDVRRLRQQVLAEVEWLFARPARCGRPPREPEPLVAEQEAGNARA
jgi:hypothetical protein